MVDLRNEDQFTGRIKRQLNSNPQPPEPSAFILGLPGNTVRMAVWLNVSPSWRHTKHSTHLRNAVGLLFALRYTKIHGEFHTGSLPSDYQGNLRVQVHEVVRPKSQMLSSPPDQSSNEVKSHQWLLQPRPTHHWKQQQLREIIQSLNSSPQKSSRPQSTVCLQARLWSRRGPE